MRLRELPGYPQLYLDFVENTGPARILFPQRPARDVLAVRAAEILQAPRNQTVDFLESVAEWFENARALRTGRHGEPGAVAVVAGLPPARAGGTVLRLLQCLTAVKLADALESHGCPSLPVAWIGGVEVEPEPDLLDSEGGLVALHEVKHHELARHYPSSIDNAESFTICERALRDGLTDANSTAVLYSGLLADLGLIVIDGADPRLARHLQAGLEGLEVAAGTGARLLRGLGYGDCSREVPPNVPGVAPPIVARTLFPVAAYVVPPPDLCEMSELLSEQVAGRGRDIPLLWPSLSATLVDARSRKTLDKFHLHLQELFEGPDRLLSKVEQSSDEAGTLGAFDNLESVLETRLESLAGVPGADTLAGAIGDSRSRMRYQVAKLRERYESSLAIRREAAGRQLFRLCNSLAPRGRRQEQQLSAIHFVLRYSRAVLTEIVGKADVWDFEHQLIPLD